MPEAAVHRHILDRMNAINDSLKIKKKGYIMLQSWRMHPPVNGVEYAIS